MAIAKAPNSKSQAPKNSLELGAWSLGFRAKRGFALLIAVIFMSVMLALGIALSSLGYKQQVLVSGAVESQHAFYAADAALECALFYDHLGNFDYSKHPPMSKPGMIICGDATSRETDYQYTDTYLTVEYRIVIDTNRCADITVYKYKTPVDNVSTSIYSQGYDVSCTTLDNAYARYVSRGLKSSY